MTKQTLMTNNTSLSNSRRVWLPNRRSLSEKCEKGSSSSPDGACPPPLLPLMKKKMRILPKFGIVSCNLEDGTAGGLEKAATQKQRQTFQVIINTNTQKRTSQTNLWTWRTSAAPCVSTCSSGLRFSSFFKFSFSPHNETLHQRLPELHLSKESTASASLTSQIQPKSNPPTLLLTTPRPPRREIIRRLADFLKNLKSAVGDSYIYRQRITSMCSNNKKSLVVDYGDLAFFEPTRVIAKVSRLDHLIRREGEIREGRRDRESGLERYFSVSTLIRSGLSMRLSKFSRFSTKWQSK